MFYFLSAWYLGLGLGVFTAEVRHRWRLADLRQKIAQTELQTFYINVQIASTEEQISALLLERNELLRISREGS